MKKKELKKLLKQQREKIIELNDERLQLKEKHEKQLIGIDQIIENERPSDNEEFYLFLRGQKELIKETIELLKDFK